MLTVVVAVMTATFYWQVFSSAMHEFSESHRDQLIERKSAELKDQLDSNRALIRKVKEDFRIQLVNRLREHNRLLSNYLSSMLRLTQYPVDKLEDGFFAVPFEGEIICFILNSEGRICFSNLPNRDIAEKYFPDYQADLVMERLKLAEQVEMTLPGQEEVGNQPAMLFARQVPEFGAMAVSLLPEGRAIEDSESNLRRVINILVRHTGKALFIMDREGRKLAGQLPMIQGRSESELRMELFGTAVVGKDQLVVNDEQLVSNQHSAHLFNCLQLPDSGWVLCLHEELVLLTPNDTFTGFMQRHGGLILLATLVLGFGILVLVGSMARYIRRVIDRDIDAVRLQLSLAQNEDNEELTPAYSEFYGLVSDVSNFSDETRIQGEALQERIDEICQGLNHLKFGVVVMSHHQGQLGAISINKEAMRMLGLWEDELTVDATAYTPAEVEILKPGNREPLAPIDTPLCRLFNGEETFQKEFILKQADSDEEQTVIFNTRVIYDETHEVCGGLLVLEDRSSRSQQEEQLRIADKMNAMNQLISVISHEFNNQLASVRGFAELMILKTPDDQTKTYAERIITAAENAGDLISRLQTFSSNPTCELKPLDLHEVLLDVADIIQRRTEGAIDFKLNLNAPVSSVLGNGSMLTHAFAAMLFNSLEAIPEHGGWLSIESTLTELTAMECLRIGVSQAAPGMYLRVTIADNGHGMSPSVCRRIFEPFYTTRENVKGAGLGLTIAYGAIQHHHGFIQVHSVTDKGTEMVVWLPMSEISPLKSSGNQALAGQNEKILVIDDEQHLLDICQASLESLGYTPICFNSPIIGFSYFQKHVDELSMVIIDLVMPELGGRELFRRIRSVNSDIPVIMISGRTVSAEVDQLLMQEVTTYIQKPFSRGELGREVHRILYQKNEA